MTEKMAAVEGEKKEVIKGVGFIEDIGRREKMEDTHVIKREFGGRRDWYFFAIYDGHGGKEGSKLAAEKLHQYLLMNLDGGTPTEALEAAFKATDSAIEFETRAGATAIVAFFEGGKLWVAGAGDARAVILREDGVERLSHDHKPNDEFERKRIEKLGGRVSRSELYELKGKREKVDENDEKRKAQLEELGAEFIQKDVYRIGSYALSRALGDRENKMVIPDPEIKGIEIRPGDKRLILACDGIWDVITDEMAADLIRNEPDPQKAAEILKAAALDRGSGDNLSVMVINLSA